eukprot:5396133-Lingulodinium_polyedra.AAC.1
MGPGPRAGQRGARPGRALRLQGHGARPGARAQLPRGRLARALGQRGGPDRRAAAPDAQPREGQAG